MEEIAKVIKNLRYFDLKELECHCGCGRCEVNPMAIRALDAMRHDAGFAFKLSSAYRCPEYNARVSHTKSKKGAHVAGVAFDILCFGEHAYRIIRLAPQYGFHRIGVQQRGDMDKRFIHIDCWTDNKAPYPWVWSY